MEQGGLPGGEGPWRGAGGWSEFQAPDKSTRKNSFRLLQLYGGALGVSSRLPIRSSAFKTLFQISHSGLAPGWGLLPVSGGCCGGTGGS